MDDFVLVQNPATDTLVDAEYFDDKRDAEAWAFNRLSDSRTAMASNIQFDTW